MTKIQFWKQFTTKLLSIVSNLRCIQYDKDTILKAIYNLAVYLRFKELAVFSMTKIQFWKQFTTAALHLRCSYRCIQYDKDTILKAIYNAPVAASSPRVAVFSMTKIQFWKQFTTTSWGLGALKCCIQYDKDTILKAIYNR